ncbi:MAG: trigger factor [Candidatus Eremiobacteraeota bacterium]|nr:trigger factor [Candidatus Eremiobacteraeota bacterium]
MKVETSLKSSVEKLLKIEVEPAKYEPILKKIINDVSREIQVPGFRRGKAPSAVVLRKVGEDTIKNDLLEKLIPKAASEALEMEKIIPLAVPAVSNYMEIEFNRGEPIKFEITVEVKPEFELTDYKGLELTKKPSKVDAEEIVDKKIEALRQQAGEMIPVEEDRPLKKGDVAVVDFESFQDGEPVENGGAQNYYMTVSDDSFIPGFIEHLIGHKPGDEWEADITFPDDYANPALAGKETHFKFKLHDIMKKKLPDYNDDFAQSIGDFQTFDEMKEDMRKNIADGIEQQEKQQLQDQVINKLIEKMEGVLVPPSLVEHNLQIFMNNLEYNLKMMKTNLKDYFEGQGTTEKEVKRQFYPKGVEMAKAELILDKVAMLEDIKATDEEIDKEIEEMAKRLNQDVQVIRKALEKENQISGFEYSIRNRKVYDFLLEHANITEETIELVNEEEPGKEIETGETEVTGEKAVEDKPETE